MKREFQRTRRRLGRYRLGSGYREVVLQVERPSKTAKVSNILAQWAQVATLAVLVFGYFYTVRPVFQKERLDEEVAQLQIQPECVNDFETPGDINLVSKDRVFS